MARPRPSRSRSRRWRLVRSPTLPEYSPRRPIWIIRTTRSQRRPLCWSRRRRLHSGLSPFPICRQRCRWVVFGHGRATRRTSGARGLCRGPLIYWSHFCSAGMVSTGFKSLDFQAFGPDGSSALAPQTRSSRCATRCRIAAGSSGPPTAGRALPTRHCPSRRSPMKSANSRAHWIMSTRSLTAAGLSDSTGRTGA